MAAPEYGLRTSGKLTDFNRSLRTNHKKRFGKEKKVAKFSFATVLKDKSTVSENLKKLNEHDDGVDLSASFDLSMPGMPDLTHSVDMIMTPKIQKALQEEIRRTRTVADLEHELKRPLETLSKKELELQLTDLASQHEACPYRSPLKSDITSYQDLEKHAEAPLRCLKCNWTSIAPGAWQNRITVRCENCKSMIYTKEVRLLRKQSKRILDFVATQEGQHEKSMPASPEQKTQEVMILE